MKKLKNIKNVRFILLACLLLLLPPSGICFADTTIAPQETVVMQLSQYNRLKTIISQQEMTLNLLEIKLENLQNTSTGQSQELTTLYNQLSDSRNQLQKTHEKLMIAEISLEKADETLKRQAESLETLTKQIKSMEHKMRVVKRQRNMWAVVAGIVTGAAIMRGI